MQILPNMYNSKKSLLQMSTGVGRWSIMPKNLPT